jgi:hypothetical protein
MRSCAPQIDRPDKLLMRCGNAPVIFQNVPNKSASTTVEGTKMLNHTFAARRALLSLGGLGLLAACSGPTRSRGW